MTKTQTPKTDDGIPSFLKRQTNAKGVTLSAGTTTEPVRATAAKKTAAPKTAKPVKEAKAPKAAKPVVEPKAAPAPVVDAEGNPLPVRRSIVPRRFKDQYKSHGGTCGDAMALELKSETTVLNADKRPSLDWPALKAIAAANGIETASYDLLNNGQKRMNVGNKLRGLLADGKDVKVGKVVFKAEDFVPKKPAAPKAKAAPAN